MPIFWHVKCYKLNKVVRQFDMVFLQTLNKFCIATKNGKDIEFINSNCNRQPPNDFTIPYLFYRNKVVQKHNENVFTNILGPTFIFKAMDINHHLTNFQMIFLNFLVCILQL